MADEEQPTGGGGEGEGAADATEEQGAGSEQAPAGGEDQGGDASEEDGDAPSDEGEEPPTRESLHNAFNAGFRKGRKAATKSTATSNGGDEDEGEEGEEGGESGSEEIDPEDLEVIDREVEKRTKPLQEHLEKQATQNEIKSFVEQYPQFKKYQQKAERYANHPTRKNLPIKTVFFEVAGDDLLKMGAQRAREVDTRKSQSTPGTGAPTRNAEGAPDPWQMPTDEFRKKQESVRRQARE